MSSAIKRTFGWVQEASVIASLKDVISIFVPNSKINKLLRTDKIPRLISKEDGRDEFIKLLEQDTIVIPYNYLKGRGLRKGETRATAPCSGIVQAVLKGQRREYQSDWPADSYLRWAISIGLLNYNRDSDTCSISTLGLRYVNATSTSEEEKVLTRAFLSNPPVVRVLSLLYKYQHLTKFEIGSQLGFVGEGGFTSIPQRLVVQALVNMPEEKSKILQDVEGTSDKYARMICSWLIQLGWVQQIEKKVTEKFGDYEYTEIIPQSYMLTLKGINVLKNAYGISSTRKLKKIVPWEMLATKSTDRVYLRNRRALIIQYLTQNYRTLEEIQNFLKRQGYKETISTIEDDLKGFEQIGLEIKNSRNKYKIMDNIIGLSIPTAENNKQLNKSEIAEIKDMVRERLKEISHKYLAIIDLSFDGKANRDFELQTIQLLTEELNFEGVRLGDKRKPDGIIYWNKNGIIIDNKAYSNGCQLPMSQADEMIRYIEENKTRDKKQNPNEWWKHFDSGVVNFNYAFISSKFIGGFKDRLKYIASRTSVNGGAINSANLLLLAEELKTKRLSYEDGFKLFNNNDEVSING